MYGYGQQNNDHLEDYDSQQGDVELDSRGATIAGSTRLQSDRFLNSNGKEPHTYNNNTRTNDYNESIRRGIRNAETQPNDETAKSPGALMDEMMRGGGFSVTTGRMDDMLERGLSDPTIIHDDTFTYDGSTITSAHDLTHKRNAQQHSVVDYNPQAALAQNAQLKAIPSKETEFTSVSSKTANSTMSTKSRVGKICCGLGKLGVVLVLLAVLAASVAIVLYLLLGRNEDTSASAATPSSACCQGSFEQGWEGREICVQGGCCVVCANSIVAANTGGNNDPVIVEPITGAPTPNPTLAPEKPITRAPDDIEQVTEPPVVATPEPTPAATTPEPTAAATTLTPTSAPTLAQSTSPPTAAPSEPNIVADTVPPNPEVGTGPPGAEVGTGVPTTEEGIPCCTGEPLWADYIGRIRCIADIDGEKCCEVCAPN